MDELIVLEKSSKEESFVHVLEMADTAVKTGRELLRVEAELSLLLLQAAAG